MIRAADLPRDVTVTLSGHIHRHQVVRHAGRSPVIYAGSIERTSFAEAPETKGYVVLDLTRDGMKGFRFEPLPARPMMTRTLSFEGVDATQVWTLVSAAIASTPADAVVQLRVTGVIPPTITAEAVRRMSGARNVTLVPRW